MIRASVCARFDELKAADRLPTPPGVKTFSLGEFRISVLRDGALAFPNDATIFGLNANPAAVLHRMRGGKASACKP